MTPLSKEIEYAFDEALAIFEIMRSLGFTPDELFFNVGPNPQRPFIAYSVVDGKGHELHIAILGADKIPPNVDRAVVIARFDERATEHNALSKEEGWRRVQSTHAWGTKARFIAALLAHGFEPRWTNPGAAFASWPQQPARA